MGLTLTEKILKAHLVDGEFIKGQEIGIKIDQDMRCISAQKQKIFSLHITYNVI